MYERGLRQQRHAQKRSSSDSDGAPRVPPASCMYWGLWWGLEPGLGVRGGPEGRQGGGSGGGLLVLLLLLLPPGTFENTTKLHYKPCSVSSPSEWL